MALASKPFRVVPRTVAYTHLRELITTGQLAANSQLSEPELAARLGISRTPIREALTALVAEGLVTRTSTNRAIVAPVSVDEMRNIYDIRARLEGLIARDACLRLTEEDRLELERKVSLMELLHEDRAEVLRIGADFHAQLELISGNSTCVNLLHVLQGHVDRYRAFTTREPGRGGRAAAEHRAILDAVSAGDPDEAEAVMKRHIELAGDVAIEWALRALGSARSL